jgi:hypothetical protein
MEGICTKLYNFVRLIPLTIFSPSPHWGFPFKELIDRNANKGTHFLIPLRGKGYVFFHGMQKNVEKFWG